MRTKIIIYIHAICFGSIGMTEICEVTLNVATLPSNLCTSGRSSACVWFICRFGISHNHPILEIVVVINLTVSKIIWQYQVQFQGTLTLLGHLKPMGLVLQVQITCAAPYLFKREFKQWAKIFSGMSCEWGQWLSALPLLENVTTHTILIYTRSIYLRHCKAISSAE